MSRMLQYALAICLVIFSLSGSLHCGDAPDAHCSATTEGCTLCACHTLAAPPPDTGIFLTEGIDADINGEILPPVLLLASDIFRPPTAAC